MKDSDIICLSKTWTTKDPIIDLKSYSKPIHSYRRFLHRRAKRPGGGIIIYVKDCVRTSVTLVKHEVDCLVWLRLVKNSFL